MRLISGDGEELGGDLSCLHSSALSGSRATWHGRDPGHWQGAPPAGQADLARPGPQARSAGPSQRGRLIPTAPGVLGGGGGAAVFPLLFCVFQKFCLLLHWICGQKDKTNKQT